MKISFLKITICLITFIYLTFSSTLMAQENNSSPQGVLVTPMHQLLLKTKIITSNYALAIVAMTLLLKLILSPLQFLSNKSALRMAQLQPKIHMIKEKWNSNPKRMQEETMRLFKNESVNPLMGFIPIFLQMPLFIAFYHLLTNSPEIVGVHFIGWLTNLAVPDPLYILPIIAGLLQMLTMKMGDQGENKISAKTKTVMSLVFIGIMSKLSVAVLIYTITSSVYALAEKKFFYYLL